MILYILLDWTNYEQYNLKKQNHHDLQNFPPNSSCLEILKLKKLFLFTWQLKHHERGETTKLKLFFVTHLSWVLKMAIVFFSDSLLLTDDSLTKTK